MQKQNLITTYACVEGCVRILRYLISLLENDS